MPESPPDRLVLSYMGDSTYHRSHRDDDLRPACRPERIRGVMSMRFHAERDGRRPCVLCWPDLEREPSADRDEE